ncbi:MAG: electron transfer flavoprotein subunit beta/FixA family protein [Actinomycetes bacterium]
MDILVCIKRVPMVGSAIILTDDAQDIDTRRLGFQLSPHEENAVEAAVQLVEKHGGSVTLLSLGTAEVEEQLREQLAIGADRAIIALTDGTEPDPQATAAALLEAIRADGATFDLLILGSESADVAGYQTGIRLAHALGLPIVTNVKGLSVDGGVARCERAVGSEREVYEVTLPAVLTVRDGLNIPRYPSVPGRIKARKKPVTTHEVSLPAPRIAKERLVVPPATAKGTTVLAADASGAQALAAVFKEIGVLS